MSFEVTPQSIVDVLLIEGSRFGDERGFFTEDYREEDFRKMGIPPFVQMNHSRSTRGVLRGLHYQLPPAAVGKLVRCIRGRILDVAVDLRKGSPSFGQHVMVELDDRSTRFLWVPAGFAHGILILSEEADVHYKQTGYWSPEHERAIRWSCPSLDIPWPKDVEILVSPKDQAAGFLEEAELFS
ncbi:MAG: dTDP-4-dehydrorhamnose 3,5-epimerase [Myxococcota bacterium]